MILDKHIQSIKTEFDGKFVGDSRHRFKVGDIGFLLELTPQTGASRIELRDSPARTAGSLTDILYGFIPGRTSVEALGAAKVVKVAGNGRGQIETLWDADLENALLELGYPDVNRDEYVSDGED